MSPMAGHSPSYVAVILAVILLLAMLAPSESYTMQSTYGYSLQRTTTASFSFGVTQHPRVSLCMVMAFPDKDTAAWSNSKEVSFDKYSQASSTNDNTSDNNKKRKVRKKYQRKRIPETEKEHIRLRRIRQAEYDHIMYNNNMPSIWSFERLFPQPVWDEETINKDLYESKIRDKAVRNAKSSQPASQEQQPKSIIRSKLKTSAIGASSMMRVWRDPKLSSYILPYDPPPKKIWDESYVDEDLLRETIYDPTSTAPNTNGGDLQTTLSERLAVKAINDTSLNGKVDLELTRMVEDKLYGMRRGSSTYDTSLMGEGAVKFRDGVRLGNPLPVNAARLNYQAKKELRHGRVDEAQELYEIAVRIDPRDGRAYLGLSRCADRRRDFKLAREFLKAGIANAVSCNDKDVPDRGANPFLLQALGVLEEKSGHLAQAEALYIEAAKSRNSHAAAWVALAQLRTQKFRQGAAAGRVCYQTAERELEKAGMPPSSHVYTAWASLEYKKAGDVRRARQLFKAALTVDPKCSAAWLQLGVMESNNGNFKEAELCFETVLKFDQRNSRVLQAYAIMETKRPDANSRKVIGLFERALKANPRDAGVLQPYALYVGDLGDIDAARDLLRRGTEVDKRHAPCWQAWGVLETRFGRTEVARIIFQQGIWACAQLAGGQSGGYSCARLWQAWGVLEAREGDDAAARRCFSRALDADKKNVAAITAWTQMEEDLGNLKDAELIFERALKQFAPGTSEKMSLWRAYELMEQRAGNDRATQGVFQRSMRETMAVNEVSVVADLRSFRTETAKDANQDVLEKSNEVEVIRWDTEATTMKADVWMNDGSIEGKVPKKTLAKMKANKQSKDP